MKAIPWIVLAIVAIFLVREFFPKRIEVVRPPRITTVHDTVRALDTAWIVKLQRRVDTQYVERVTLTLPETVYVAPEAWGLTALQIAAKVGDSSLAQGFSIMPGDDSGSIVRMGWRVQMWTPGPLRGLIILPRSVRAEWGDPPPKDCNLWCTLKHYGIGAAGGWAVCKL